MTVLLPDSQYCCTQTVSTAVQIQDTFRRTQKDAERLIRTHSVITSMTVNILTAMRPSDRIRKNAHSKYDTGLTFAIKRYPHRPHSPESGGCISLCNFCYPITRQLRLYCPQLSGLLMARLQPRTMPRSWQTAMPMPMPMPMAVPIPVPEAMAEGNSNDCDYDYGYGCRHGYGGWQ